MISNIPQAVRERLAEYRRFLRTSSRFLDEHLRRQFEEHLDRTAVIMRGPYVPLDRDFERGRTLRELVVDMEKGRGHGKGVGSLFSKAQFA